ncbi:DUF4062 domain-containing protein [Nostoc punctiforme UO1]|uniref:DUF4062 domain-containing protein n=1 Tax=Nostoc punctiforme TaxID=272131 RepID=UPI003098779A
MSRDNWSNLVIETAVRPIPLPDDRFRQWIAGKGIFISSRRDDELTPVREAVRNYLNRIGAYPIMWEEITPRDENSQRAYLTGVDQSNVFVLIVGSSYGVADSSGYSPIHQEGNRAVDRKIPRLLFLLDSVKDSERDGRLNDWLLSLYKEISGASFTIPENLVTQLDARLREMAAHSSLIWIKLGNLIFPGHVKSNFGVSGEGNSFTVTARVTQGSVRHTLLNFNQSFSYANTRLNRLTWSNHSFPVQVKSVLVESEFTIEDAVVIECFTPRNSSVTSESSATMMTFNNSNGQSFSPVDLARIWAERAIFGKDTKPERNVLDIYPFTKPDTKTLTELLAETNGSSWLAQGLTRLYLVEEFSQRYRGYFEHLNIGSATATGIRIDGAFILESVTTFNKKVVVEGVIPLTR